MVGKIIKYGAIATLLACAAVVFLKSSPASAYDYAASDAGIDAWCKSQGYSVRALGDYLTMTARGAAPSPSATPTIRIAKGAATADIDVYVRGRYCGKPTTLRDVSAAGIKLSGQATFAASPAGSSIAEPYANSTAKWYRGPLKKRINTAGWTSGTRTIYFSFGTKARHVDGAKVVYAVAQQAPLKINVVVYNVWSLGLTTQFQTARNNNHVGQEIGFQHQIKNAGPNATDKAISYGTRIVRVATGGGVTATTAPNLTQVLAAYDAHTTANPTRIQAKTDYPAIASNKASGAILRSYASFVDSAETRHTITQADVGKWLCSYATASPSAYNSTAWKRSTPVCKYIPNDYNLTPTISDVTPAVFGAGDDITVSGHVAKTGNALKSANTDTRYVRILYKEGQAAPRMTGGTATGTACAFYTVSADRCTEYGADEGTAFNNYQYAGASTSVPSVTKASPDDFDPGDRLCFGMYVKGYSDTTGPSKSGMRLSDLRCVIVGKKPKIHINGGDLYVREGEDGGNVATSTGPTSGKVYGSWTEYGIAAAGTVSGMGSAAGYAGGVDQAGGVNLCSVSLLTFANRPQGMDTCSLTDIGHYILPSLGSTVVDYYASRGTASLGGSITPSSTASGVYTTTTNGTVTVNGGEVPLGKSVVIYAPNSNVNIAGDIRYSNSTMNNIGQIPQVVIIAGDITVRENVNWVDAWLVATTSGRGTISTCGRTPANDTQCGATLHVNGPVIANKLYLQRTAGATKDDPRVPAEEFNLRPDAYLWASQQAGVNRSIPTAAVTELPPRF